MGTEPDYPGFTPIVKLVSSAEQVRQAMDRLTEKQRVQLEARMLPRSAKLKPEQVQAVRDQLAAYMAEHAIPAARVARETHYSPAVISAWQAGHYAGNHDAVAHAVNDWMERDARRAQSARAKDYVKTAIAEDIRTIAHMADKRLCMAAVVVPSGAGKTYVLKALADEMRGVYLYCTPSGPREFLHSLALALGRRGAEGARKAALYRWVIDQLRDTKRILLFDEAHALGKTVSTVRSLHDEAGVPVVLAGTDDILNAINDRRDGRGQLSSRCIRYNALDRFRNAEDPSGGPAAGGRELFSVDEVKAFFDSRKIRLAKDALMLLWAIACMPNYGCLRLVERTVETVFDLDPELETVKRADVLLALRMIVGAEVGYLESVADRHTERQAAAARVA